MTLLYAAGSALLLLAFFGACIRWERQDRSVMVVVALIALLIVDVSLYGDTSSATAAGVFDPRLGGQGVRLIQLALLVAVVARLLVRGLPRRWVSSTLLWIAFFAWLGISAVVGYVQGHPTSLILREATLVPILGGGMLLVGGVPARQFTNDIAFRWLLVGAAIVSTALLFLDTLGIRLTTSAIPGVPLTALGLYGADAATVFSSLGLIGLTIGLSFAKGHSAKAAWLIPSVLLILSLFATPQRAARLGLVVALAILVVAFVSSAGRQRFRLSHVWVLLASLTVVTGILAATFIIAAVDLWSPSANATSTSPYFKNPFAATDRQGSVQSRFNQWAVARAQIKDSPFFGDGLGGTTIHYEAGKHEFVEGDITHNIGLDLLYRVGLLGILLAFSALAVLSLDALSIWRRHEDNVIAAVAVAAFATTCGILAKGMVESIFEKERLAVLLALTLGLMVSASLTPFADRERP